MWRFTIRDAMLLTIIIALVIAWGLDHYRLYVVQERLDTVLGECASRNLTFEFDNEEVWITRFPAECSGCKS